jgi:hypothetical protein
VAGPFYFAWAGGTIVDPLTVVTVGNTEEANLVVTGIPDIALAALTPGLRYNAIGNAIPVGTTFVAPDLGATSIELDQAPTATQPAAILTLNGPRAINAPFDPAIHNRFDEEVLGIEIAQSEGDFATLTVDIKNTGVGLLATGRNLWCWLSWDQAWTPAGGDAPDLVPLFNGRLVGVPQLAAGEVMQLQFLARPDDYNVQKLGLADSMQVLPFWDPVWLATQAGNPDTVLETYSALWHTDRTTLEVTTSDILEGEDGIVTIGEDQAFYDNFAMSFGDAPLRQVSVSGTVSWEQTGEGDIDITPSLFHAFGDAGNLNTVFSDLDGTKWHKYLTKGGVVYTFNGSAVKSSWPQPGTSIGAGWEVAPGTSPDGKALSFIVDASSPLGWIQPMAFNINYVGPPPGDTSGVQRSPADGASDFTAFISHGTWQWGFSLNAYFIRMVVHYQAARAKLRARARSVEITFGCDWPTALGIGLRHSVALFDRRIPGGSAIGKVKQCRLTVGESGMFGEFTIGCTTGAGNAAVAATGINGYVDDGYVDDGYQVIAGSQRMFLTDELAYQTLDQFEVVDDGLNFYHLTAEQVVKSCTVLNGLDVQMAELNKYQNVSMPQAGLSDPFDAIKKLTTTITLELVPVTGSEYHTDYLPAVSMLAIPQTIDLRAPAPG